MLVPLYTALAAMLPIDGNFNRVNSELPDILRQNSTEVNQKSHKSLFFSVEISVCQTDSALSNLSLNIHGH